MGAVSPSAKPMKASAERMVTTRVAQERPRHTNNAKITRPPLIAATTLTNITTPTTAEAVGRPKFASGSRSGGSSRAASIADIASKAAATIVAGGRRQDSCSTFVARFTGCTSIFGRTIRRLASKQPPPRKEEVRRRRVRPRLRDPSSGGRRQDYLPSQQRRGRSMAQLSPS